MVKAHDQNESLTSRVDEEALVGLSSSRLHLAAQLANAFNDFLMLWCRSGPIGVGIAAGCIPRDPDPLAFCYTIQQRWQSAALLAAFRHSFRRPVRGHNQIFEEREEYDSSVLRVLMAILKQSAWDLAQSLEIKFVGWDGDVKKLSDEQPDGIIDHLKTKVARFDGQSEMNSASRRIEDQQRRLTTAPCLKYRYPQPREPVHSSLVSQPAIVAAHGIPSRNSAEVTFRTATAS
jgi:hypothetical protein